MLVAFTFFDLKGERLVRKSHMMELIVEMGEFLCCVSRGLISSFEFINLKKLQLKRFFAGIENDVMDYKQFTERAVSNHRLICCYEFLDMIFGRVVRQMEADLGVKRVFGRSLQETTLGHVKDIFGKSNLEKKLLIFLFITPFSIG
jgi:hypothetical protein